MFESRLHRTICSVLYDSEQGQCLQKANDEDDEILPAWLRIDTESDFKYSCSCERTNKFILYLTENRIIRGFCLFCRAY